MVVALSTNDGRHKTQRGINPNQKHRGPPGDTEHWALCEHQLLTSHMPLTTRSRTSDFQIQCCSGFISKHFPRCAYAQVPALPDCGLPHSGLRDQSPEEISKLLNSLCQYLYSNDRTLRCKLHRNLVSKSCHFLMVTSIKAAERHHTVAKPQEWFQRPTCKPRAQCVLEILSHQSIYGQGFFPPQLAELLDTVFSVLPVMMGLCACVGPQGCCCFCQCGL